MRISVQKWGNSLAIRIPRHLAQEAKIQEGSSVEIEEQGGNIVLHPVQQEETLEDILSRVTPENLHSEINWGRPQGGEIW